MILFNSIRIDSKEKLAKAVEKYQILPFFPNNIHGLSVEEMCAPGMLFGGNYDEGCWEWKGPVLRKGIAAYGKFFRRKAGFVGIELLADFLNFRRNAYPIKPESTEEMLYEIIRENDSLSSTELKKLIFGNNKRENWEDLPEINNIISDKPKSKSLESPLQRLQMGGWIIISDFEYKRTKKGERYGWGVARYSTPENVFGDKILEIREKSPEESLQYVIEAMKKRVRLSIKSSWEKLLR